MICECCKNERLISDFINNHEICYRCVFRQKTTKDTEKRTDPPVLCRICSQPVVRDKELKKRQRTVYCSYECAETGHKHQLENHWTRLVRQKKDLCNSSGEKNKWKTNL